MKTVWRSRRLLIHITLASVVGAALTLWIAHYITQASQLSALKSYSDYALNYASGVTSDLKESVADASSSPHEPCSDRDLSYLRGLLWQHRYPKDIGRFKNGKLACTAERGVFSKPIQLPKPTTTLKSRARFWNEASEVLGIAYQTDMVELGGVLVMTSPFAFDAMRPPTKNMSAAILSEGNNYTFRTFGVRPVVEVGSFVQFWHPLPSALSYSSCSDAGLCVVGGMEDAGVYSLAWLEVILIALLGGFGFGGLYTLIYLALHTRNTMLFQLRKAIRKRELTVVYQPKLCIEQNTVVGAEALVRWHSKQFGFVAPDTFVELAENNQLIRPLSRLVIEKSLSEMQSLLQERPDFKLSINLAIQDLLDETLLPFLISSAEKLNIPPQQLVCEITERSAGDHAQLAEVVQHYQQMGIGISLDDFGTGYSNLVWLGHLSASEIKVDKTFTQSIGTGSINQNMLDAIFSLLQSLDVVRVFEGVETQSQEQYILEKCPDAVLQGWLYSKALPAKELEAFIGQYK